MKQGNPTNTTVILQENWKEKARKMKKLKACKSKKILKKEEEGAFSCEKERADRNMICPV